MFEKEKSCLKCFHKALQPFPCSGQFLLKKNSVILNIFRKCFMRPKFFTAADAGRSFINQSVYFSTGKNGHPVRLLSSGEVQ